MKRKVTINSDSTVKVEMEFNLYKDNPQTYTWLKNFVLFDLRETHSLTDKDMANILGVSDRTIQSWRYQFGIKHSRGGDRRSGKN